MAAVRQGARSVMQVTCPCGLKTAVDRRLAGDVRCTGCGASQRARAGVRYPSREIVVEKDAPQVERRAKRG